MPPNPIDRPLVRLVLGALVGLPLSAVAVVAAPHGLILGYGGLMERDPLLVFAGLMTVLGVVAIFGAWRRLLVPSTKMAPPQARRIRFCLFCGIVSSFGLGAWAGYEAEPATASMLALIALFGVVLVKGTPIPNAL